MKRQSRVRRHRGVRVELTRRDALVLEALARFRAARTRDVVAVAFAGVHPMTARMRLRRLFDGGFLAVRAGDRSEENVYTLGPEGRRWAIDQGVPVGRAPRGEAAHHLAIVHVWAGFVEAVQGLAGLALDLARPDWELREQFSGRSLDIVPDLFVLLRSTASDGVEQVAAVAIEVDLGTESLTVLQRKLSAYARVQDRSEGLFGWPEFGLGVALGNEGRMTGVRRLLEQSGIATWLLWSQTGRSNVPLVELVSAFAGRTRPPVTDPRCRNSTAAAVSRVAAVAGKLTGGGH
jgi:hypothetical protein